MSEKIDADFLIHAANRYELARLASLEASERGGIDRGQLQVILDSWQDVASLHDELKRAMRTIMVERAGLQAVINSVDIDHSAYGQAWKALFQESPQCEELVWPEKKAEETIQCPQWSISADPDGVPRCGLHLKAFQRLQAIQAAKEKRETWELVGWEFQQSESLSGYFVKAPYPTHSYDNEVEAREAEAEAKRFNSNQWTAIYARQVPNAELVDAQGAGLRLLPEPPDELHNIGGAVVGITPGSNNTLSGVKIDDKHSVNVDSSGPTLKLSCNDCDYTWEGMTL